MHIVAVYGTLKTGYGNNYLLQDSEFIGRGETKHSSFKMTSSGIPFVYFSNEGHPIGVEVYQVSDETLKKLDWLEGHPNFYCREQIAVIAGGEEHLAWIYVIKDGYGSNALNVEPNEDGLIIWERD